MKNHFQTYIKYYTEILNSVKTTRKENLNDKNVADLISCESFFDYLKNEFDKLRSDNNRSIFFVGNGASASMSSHFATDFTKNIGIRSFSLNDSSLITCYSNDFSFDKCFEEILKRYMKEGDALVAISCSGKSQNILEAAKLVKGQFKNNLLITFSGFDKENPLSKLGDYNLYVSAHEYGIVESVHAFYLHAMLDLYSKQVL
ncbi:MAG: SIS domain-containing protein [Oligoflexia bacterium]|nr:SIS domain-containing protein [Oligoflexia bacterium]